MKGLFTSGSWRVRDGKEEAFVTAWRELAEWTSSNVPGAAWAKLLRDRDDPRHFVSFGPWENAEAIHAWRASEGFQERVGRIREVLESFEPMTGDVVAEVG